jgi:signal peptidase I
MENEPENPEKQSLDRKRAKVRGVRRWIKRARIIFALVTVTLAVYIFLSYRIYTVPGEYHATSNKIQSPITEVQPGDTLVLLNLNLWREPRLGDIVIYDHPNPRDGVPSQLIGRIAGLPGEKIVRNGPTMQVADRLPLPVGFPYGEDVPINSGDVVPDGEYLIVTDTDAVAYADSRDFGFIKREAIQKKVIFDLAFILGQRTAPPADNNAASGH